MTAENISLFSKINTSWRMLENCMIASSQNRIHI